MKSLLHLIFGKTLTDQVSNIIGLNKEENQELKMDSEDPNALLKFIQSTYRIFEFDPTTAKDYDLADAELYKELHAKFILKGFK